jgi:hypothetical protein
MYILDFIKNLLPHIDKNNIIEDTRITIAELENIVIPSYKVATEAFKTTKINSSTNKTRTDVFYRNIDLQGYPKQDNLVAEIYRRLPLIKDNLTYLLTLAEELFERDIINEGLSAKKAIILRAIASMSFISRYSIDLLNVIYVDEELKAGSSDDIGLSPAVIKHLETKYVIYIKALSDYGITNKVFVKLFVTIPEIVISSKNSNAISGLYKEKEVDPFASAYSSNFVGSPIFSLRLLVTEWQAGRYKTSKDKKKLLELRLLHLQMKQDNSDDPKLEQEILYLQSRIDKLSRRLHEIEDSVK